MAVILTTAVFDRWFERLRDRKAAARVQARIDRAEAATWATAGRRWWRLGAADRLWAGLPRVLRPAGLEVIILLAGGDKGSQAKDIEAAKALAKQV